MVTGAAQRATRHDCCTPYIYSHIYTYTYTDIFIFMYTYTYIQPYIQLLELHSALYATIAAHQNKEDRFRALDHLRDTLDQ